MAATANAPAMTSTDRSRRTGRWGIGIPVGISPTSSTRDTPLVPMTSRIAVGTTRAMSAAYGPSFVGLSQAMIASAASPATSVGRYHSPGCNTTSSAFSAANDPSPDTPVRSANCENRMFTATPVRKPVMTDCDTNRVYRPSLRIPATIIATPAMSVSRNNACGRSAGARPESAEPAASAAALVVVTTISWVLLVSPPISGPANEAYNPWIGLTPVNTLAAIPSGTLPIALGTPTIASDRNSRPSAGRIPSHQRAAPRCTVATDLETIVITSARVRRGHVRHRPCRTVPPGPRAVRRRRRRTAASSRPPRTGRSGQRRA